VKQKYNIEIKQNQILRFVPVTYDCSIELTHGEQDTIIFGKASHLYEMPLRVEFIAPPGSHQRSLFESLIKESTVTQQPIDLKIDCDMLLYGSSLNESSSQMHRHSFFTSEFEDDSKLNNCEQSLFSGKDVELYEYLNVRSDMLRSIPKGVFRELWNLKNLTLFRDKTEEYEEIDVSKNELHVFRNKMSIFPQKTLIGFKNLIKKSNSEDEDLLDLTSLSFKALKLHLECSKFEILI
jgi:hypothetical protein